MLKGLKAECPVHKMSSNECSCSNQIVGIGDLLIRAVGKGAVTVYRQLVNCTNTSGQLKQQAAIPVGKCTSGQKATILVGNYISGQQPSAPLTLFLPQSNHQHQPACLLKSTLIHIMYSTNFFKKNVQKYILKTDRQQSLLLFWPAECNHTWRLTQIKTNTQN